MIQKNRFWQILGGLLLCSNSAFAGTLGFGNAPTDLAFQGILIGALGTLLVVLLVNLAWSFFRTDASEAPAPRESPAPAPAAVQYVAVPHYQAFPVMQPFWGQPPMSSYPSYPQQVSQPGGVAPVPYPQGESAGASDGSRHGASEPREAATREAAADFGRREGGCEPAPTEHRSERAKAGSTEGSQPPFDPRPRSTPSTSETATRRRASASPQGGGEARGLFEQIVRQNIQIREGLEKEKPLASSKGAK